MRRQTTWLPHPLLSVLLLVLWLLLNDSLALGHILLGAVLGLLIPLFTKRFWPEMADVRRPLMALRLVGIVLYDIVVANFIVARIVLGSADAVKPVFLRIPIDLEGNFAITVLMSVISLTPGTVSAELEEEHRYLLVHALSEDEPDSLARHIKQRYEEPIKEIFAC
jgi:multicomponent K+:H+ antiporter subunit E